LGASMSARSPCSTWGCRF